MPIATIIGAIVAAGASIVGGVMQNKATEKANKTNLALAGTVREDTLQQQAVQNQQTAQSIALSRRQIDIAEKENALNRTERTEEKGYNRMQHAADKYAEYLNNKTALTSARLTPLMNRGR